MNSIRPFATVLILIVIGIGLYMVINTSEPIPPDEVAGEELAIPEIEEDLAELADESAPEAYPVTGSTTPFPSDSEMTAPPPWSPPSEAPPDGDQPDASLTTSAPPLPAEPPAAQFSGSAAESVLPAEGSIPAAQAANAFSSQLQSQVQGAASPQSVANPHVHAPPAAPAPEQSLGNIPAVSEVQEFAGSNGGTTAPAATADPYAVPLPSSDGSPQQPTTTFSVAWHAVQESLQRGELSQALLMLSQFYGDPQLTPAEQTQLNTLLGQLAGTVIYSTSHELEQPYRVQPGETLADIAQAYSVTPELLAKINGVADPNHLEPGTELKVVRGPFHAVLDATGLRLELDGRYAGRFPAQGPVGGPVFGAAATWTVQQKVPAGNPATASQLATSGKHLILVPAESGSEATSVAIVADAAIPPGDPRPVVRVSQRDLADIYDILTIGSRVTVRR